MEVPSQEIEPSDRSLQLRHTAAALGIGAVGAAVGWLGSKGYEALTDSNLDLMEEVIFSLGGSIASVSIGLVASIEYAIRRQNNPEN